MQKDAWSKFSLDSLVTNRDKKFCDADTLTEEMKEFIAIMYWKYTGKQIS